MDLVTLKDKRFLEVTFQDPKIKRTHSEKISYISRNGTF